MRISQSEGGRGGRRERNEGKKRVVLKVGAKRSKSNYVELIILNKFKSKQIARVIIKFILALDGVFLEQPPLFGSCELLHGHLVEVGEQFVFLCFYPAVVAHQDASLVVSEHLVLFDLRKARTRANDARPLVFVDLVVADVGTTVEHDDAV